MTLRIRAVVSYRDETLAERGLPVATRVRRAFAAAVIENPWLGSDTRADLQEEVARIAAPLAITLSSYVYKLLGDPHGILAYGKGAIVGLDGEVEHGSALLHTPYFGNIVRERLDGTEYISFADAIGVAGTPLTLPLGHKTNGGLRDFFETVPVEIPDAPQPDEIVVVLGAADGPRPNARIGDRTTDRAVRLDEFADHHLIDRRVP